MKKTNALRITRPALMAATMLAVKAALGAIPNFELVTFFVIIYSVYFGKEVFFAIAVFNLCELFRWGFGPWWIAYLYIWNIIAALSMILKKHFGEDTVLWAVFSALTGLFFGAMCSLAQIPTGTAWGYFIAGLPWDLWHGISNFILMLVLFKPISEAMKKVNR